MTIFHYIGALLVLALIIGIGIYSGRKVTSAKDFTAGGKKAGAGIVMGSIIGTLVGGSSTIGTSQLAFSYGFSAWWFTLGGSIGVLTLLIGFSKPLYNSDISTLPQVLSREYGRKTGTVAALLNSLGSFLSIVAQILSGCALITAVSNIGIIPATFLTIFLMLVYVVFGGSFSAGYVGIAKTILLYLSVGACGIFAIISQGGFSAFTSVLSHETYFNLFARGASVDLGAGISLILGVLTTQSYIQAVISAKTLKLSRIGLLWSAVLIPLIGVAGIFVGMYMKLNYPDISSKMALPLFILEKMPPLVAGIMLATLFIAVVGTGAGLALGISSILCNDIYKVYINKKASDTNALNASRFIIVSILAIAAVMSMGNMGDLILNWSFMSMGLRGSVAFGPMCAALFLPGKIPPKFAMAAILAGPILTLAGKFMLPATIDSLFLGVACSFIILTAGCFAGKRK